MLQIHFEFTPPVLFSRSYKTAQSRIRHNQHYLRSVKQPFKLWCSSEGATSVCEHVSKSNRYSSSSSCCILVCSSSISLLVNRRKIISYTLCRSTTIREVFTIEFRPFGFSIIRTEHSRTISRGRGSPPVCVSRRGCSK